MQSADPHGLPASQCLPYSFPEQANSLVVGQAKENIGRVAKPQIVRGVTFILPKEIKLIEPNDGVEYAGLDNTLGIFIDPSTGVLIYDGRRVRDTNWFQYPLQNTFRG